MLVLGIETSCDETAVALYDADRGLLSNQVYSQIPIHQVYGGVVPELASRDHLKKTLPLIQTILPDIKHIDGVAYTKGPGLIGALMVGASIAHSLAYALAIPVIGVHHLEAHIMAVMLEDPKPAYPFVALLISGGHTLLLRVNSFGQYQLLGETLDDAVGEAFDKTATLLNLSYPGGPALSQLAEQGDMKRFKFPRPMVDRPGFDFSFSGLKTFALNCVKSHEMDKQTHADIACAFEEAAVDTLLIKTRRALENTGIRNLVVAGGVSANKRLRRYFTSTLDADIFFPRPAFCTDNAAMVAYTGCRRLNGGQDNDDCMAVDVKARWPIQALSEGKDFQ